jgi:hypothetical protein
MLRRRPLIRTIGFAAITAGFAACGGLGKSPTGTPTLDGEGPRDAGLADHDSGIDIPATAAYDSGVEVSAVAGYDTAVSWDTGVVIDLRTLADGPAIDLRPEAVGWTRQMGTSGYEMAYGVATDGFGNVYVVGDTSGDLDGNVSAGGTDLFILKYDASGARQWTHQMGTSGMEYAYGVATDSIGNVYVVGATSGSLGGNASAGGVDLFILKYDASGMKQWTSQLGTSSDDYATSVATDSADNVYVVGHTGGRIGGNGAGGVDLFILKYDASGVRQWNRQLGTSGDDYGMGVATDSVGNVYAVGYTDGGFDGYVSAGQSDLLVAKYDASGVKQWTRQMGTAWYDHGLSAATDLAGNVYVAGYAGGGLDGNRSSGGYEAFVAKYDGSGVKQWTRQMGTTGDDWGSSVATDSAGSIYVVGYTNGNLDGNVGSGGYDCFVAKYDGRGVKQWTRQMGTTAIDYALGVATSSAGSVYLVGLTGGNLAGNINAGGEEDLFVTKLTSP